MKTKFLRAPQGDENKHLRERIRDHGRAYLTSRAHQIQRYQLDKATHYIGKLNLFRLFVLPDDSERGYLSCAFNDHEVIRFYLSPGNYVGGYIADKIEFVYSNDDTTVSFDVSGQEWAQTLFDDLDSRLSILSDVIKSQNNAN